MVRHPGCSGVYVEDGRIDELAASQKRVEDKQNAFEVNFARVETRLDTKLDNIAASLSVLSTGLTGLDIRVGAVERSVTGLDSRVTQLDKSNERRATSWPAVVSTITSVIMALLIVAGILYLGPTR